MSVILCRRERVSHPFFIESLGIRVGSSQELCYAFYHHPLLLIDDLMGQDLMDFIREELGMGATAGRMEKWIRSGENPDDALIMFMQDCDYYSSLEISRFRQQLVSLRKLPTLEYEKKKGDCLFGFRQYGKAIDIYQKILEMSDHMKCDDKFLGRVWNNLAVCYTRIFQFGKAMDAFEKAFLRLKQEKILESMYQITCLNPGSRLKDRYEALVTPEKREIWDQEIKEKEKEAENCEKLKELEQLFAGDLETRMKEAARQVEAWKQDYRRMA